MIERNVVNTVRNKALVKINATTIGNTPNKPKVKPIKPKLFDGTKGTLRRYITQFKVYQSHYK